MQNSNLNCDKSTSTVTYQAKPESPLSAWMSSTQRVWYGEQREGWPFASLAMATQPLDTVDARPD